MRSWKYAAALALGYVTIAGAYIAVSSALAARSSASVEELARIEEIKGAIFVLVTGLSVLLGSWLAFARIEAAASARVLQERALVSSSRRALAGIMASTVAHDANNVLVVVLSDLDELEEAGAAVAPTVARLKRSVNSLIALNRRLLEMGKQEANAHRAVIGLGDCVRESVRLVRHHPAVRGVSIEVSDRGRVIPLVAHETLVSQIVGNLVVNAAEATGGRGTVWVQLEVRGDQALIEVHDAGPGIPESRWPTLFDSLESTKPEGNGMGLFSVKACARGLNGRVEVARSPHGGACFRVALPLPSSPPPSGTGAAPRVP
jgi:two-component system sensor histidine kinase HydH